MCTTSLDVFELGKKLRDDYEERRNKEKDMNKRKSEPVKANAKATNKEGVSRTVTEIDYDKHERTVAELHRQEAEEEYNRKKADAAQWCTLDHEHGPECKRPQMGCSHDHQKEWQIYEKSTEEKLNAADRFRQEGNESFRKNNYGLAAVHYRKALLQFDYTFAEGPAEEKRHDDLKLACLLNLAACKSQQEEWDDVLTHCRLALELNPRSVKAYYRTGLAHLARDQFELAKDALLSAYEIEPQNAEVLARLKQLKTNIADYKVKRKEIAKEMISGVDADEPATVANGASIESGTAVIEEIMADAVATHAVSSTQDLGTKATAADQSEGLRQRRPEPSQKDSPTDLDDDPDDDEESLKALHGQATKGLLIVAAFLGVAAVAAACIAAMAAD